MLQPPEPGGSGYAITNGRAGARPYRADYRSDRFASSQSRSSSDKESAESWVPLSAASVSIARNLRANFSVAVCKRSSVSKLRFRAKFTIENKRSPNSSESSSLFFATSISEISSRIFANTSPASGQSKPARAAFNCTFWALANAGSVRGIPSMIDFRSCFSERLIASHWRKTASLVESLFSPKTCGCRSTSLSAIRSAIWSK